MDGAVYNTFNDLQNNNHAGQASATFYTYDVHGNVDTLLQDYNQGIMQSTNHRFKKIVYRYDLISGKVNYVIYQPGEVDAFYHHYLYDAENRITSVLTSKDSIYWESDARYQYYKHGPLARTVLGQQQVQGLDYIYTLQGWLKAINPVAPLLGGNSGSGEGCEEGTAVNELVVNTRLVNTPDEYVARELISFEEGFENGNLNDYFDAVIDEALAICNKTSSNNDGCGNGTAIN